MKKIFAILMALCLFCGAALAEPVEINWADLEPALEQSGVAGDFVTFDEVAVKMWLPSELHAAELTDEDREQGFIGYFTDDAGETVVSVVYANVDGMSIEDYATYLTNEGMKEVTPEIINGLYGVEYQIPDQDSLSIAFATEAGYILEVTMAPLSVEGAEYVWGMVGASIQPE